jgi:hypothetical protein
MPQRITPSKIVTVSQDGEVHITITLELNINLNTSGVVQVAAQQSDEQVKKAEKEDDEVDWEIPEFSPVSDFQFGKDVS